MQIAEFQALIDRIYGPHDRARGADGTFVWMAEEVGELARAMRQIRAAPSAANRANLEEEFADVLAWLSSLASMHGVDLAAAAQAKYPGHCIKCSGVPCSCVTKPKA
jgi:NTP pyrophosphatase (non-canonical NTP hydrolase)